MSESEKLSWEKKKAYLVQSLFQDVSMASFTAEEDAPSPVVWEPSSPLSPLNVEVIRKPNPHDESEEFYMELEIKMKKLYRTIFYNEDLGSDDDIKELSQYITCYESGNTEMKMSPLDVTAKKESIYIGDVNIVNFSRQQEIRHEKGITQGERESIDKYEDSTDSSDDVKQITCIADVHCEDIDTDGAKSIGNEPEGNQSPILPCSLKKHVYADKRSMDIGKLDVEDDTNDVGENQKSTQESLTLHPISDNDSSGESTEIMRCNNAKKLSMCSARTIRQSSTSSPLHVDLERSSSLDFELELFQISSLNNPTQMEITFQDMESKLYTTKDTDSLHNESTDETDNDVHVKESENLTKNLYKVSSTPKSKHVNNTSHSEYGEDKTETVNNELLSKPNKKIDKTIDKKGMVIEDLERKSEFSDDEYDTFEVNSVSNLDVDDLKISANKAITIEDSYQNAENSERKSILFHKNTDKMERRVLVPATSTPKSRTIMTQSIVEETGSVDELNAARISWPSNSTGTKRVLQEFTQEYKRRKYIDVGVQTDVNLYRNELNNNFFVGIPSIYKLCRCVNHWCDR